MEGEDQNFGVFNGEGLPIPIDIDSSNLSMPVEATPEKILSPPRRISRPKRSSTLTSPKLPNNEASDGIRGQLRSFCESEGLSVLAQRCGLLEVSPASLPRESAFLRAKSEENELDNPPLPEPLSLPQLGGPLLPQPTLDPSPVAAPKINQTIKKKKPIKADKSAKGLRHFSLLVMLKVKEKKETTYNEVADELVQQIQTTANPGKKKFQNIRRRVYDALNVLRAIRIINKQKKTISWVGLQHSPQSLEALNEQKKKLQERILQKQESVKELQKQFTAYDNIVNRNKAGPLVAEDKRIAVPFILVSTQIDANIDCEMAENRTEYCFLFEKPFRLYTEVQLLEMMNMAGPPQPQTPQYQRTDIVSPQEITPPNSVD